MDIAAVAYPKYVLVKMLITTMDSRNMDVVIGSCSRYNTSNVHISKMKVAEYLSVFLMPRWRHASFMRLNRLTRVYSPQQNVQAVQKNVITGRLVKISRSMAAHVLWCL